MGDIQDDSCIAKSGCINNSSLYLYNNFEIEVFFSNFNILNNLLIAFKLYQSLNFELPALHN